MKLYQRNGTYYVSNGNQKVSLFTDDEPTARQIYADLVKSIVMQKLNLTISIGGVTAAAAVKKRKKRRVRIEPIYADYLQSCRLRKVTENTMLFKKNTLEKMLDAGIKYISDADQKHVNKFISLVSVYAQDTQRKYFTSLLSFLNAAVKKGYLRERQVKGLEIPKTKDKVRDLVITDADLKKIYDYLRDKDPDFYFYLLTLYNTFSRPGEVIELQAKDFNLHDRYADVWQNKTQKTKRVYLYKEYCAEIAEWLAMKGNDYLFEGRNAGSEFYGKKFSKLRDRLKINPKYTLYTFRHTSITELMNKTNDVEFVARQAGNNPEITMKHYINRHSQHYLDMMDKD